MVNGVCVSNGFAAASRYSCFSISGRPEDRTQRGSVISRTWATSPRRPSSLSRAPRGRTRAPTRSVGRLLVPNQACSGTDRRLVAAPLPDVVFFIQSERSDLNRGHRRAALVAPVPRTGAITRLRYVLMPAARRPTLRVGARSNPSLRRPTLRVGARRGVSCADRQTGRVVLV